MVRKNHTRRRVLQTFGASLIGASGIGSAKQDTVSLSTANESDLPSVKAASQGEIVGEMAVEGDNNVNGALSVGYYDSELQNRWVDGSLVERWVHFFEASFTATVESDLQSYNINKQFFDTRFYGGTEHNGAPSAGSAAWPDPPIGNWSQVVDAVVEASLGALSTVASLGLSADDIKEAYENDPFDTERSDKIYFEADYGGYYRESASHSVNFTADQVPGTDGMVDILSAAGDIGAANPTAAMVYLYPEDDTLYKYPPGSRSSASVQDSSKTTSIRDSFDAMSQAELAEQGVKRVNPSELSKQTIQESRFNLRNNEPTYVKSFNFDVEFGAKNGSVHSTSTR